VIVSELITYFVSAGLSLALAFLPVFDSVRATVDSVGTVFAAIPGPVSAVVSSVIDAIGAVSGSINARTLP
jgi:hypothetical protein